MNREDFNFLNEFICNAEINRSDLSIELLSNKMENLKSNKEKERYLLLCFNTCLDNRKYNLALETFDTVLEYINGNKDKDLIASDFISYYSEIKADDNFILKLFYSGFSAIDNNKDRQDFTLKNLKLCSRNTNREALENLFSLSLSFFENKKDILSRNIKNCIKEDTGFVMPLFENTLYHIKNDDDKINIIFNCIEFAIENNEKGIAYEMLKTGTENLNENNKNILLSELFIKKFNNSESQSNMCAILTRYRNEEKEIIINEIGQEVSEEFLIKIEKTKMEMGGGTIKQVIREVKKRERMERVKREIIMQEKIKEKKERRPKKQNTKINKKISNKKSPMSGMLTGSELESVSKPINSSNQKKDKGFSKT